MSLTLTLKKRSKWMNMICNIWEIDFDISYPSNGEPLTNADLGLPEGVTGVLAFPRAGYVFEYVEASELLKAYWCDNDALADSAMVEVTNGTNLSGVTGVKVLALGI